MSNMTMKSLIAPILLLSAKALAGCPASCLSSAALTLSCTNTTAVADTCCYNYPGGQLLQTQFWDTNPAAGPPNSWTVHGLWPDNCDGTYYSYCDQTRQYKNITQILESFGQTSLLSFMKTYWADYHGQEESFWEHEFNKHGTCISTLNPSCYQNYTATEEVVDYFRRTVDLYKTLNTYQFLKAAGIVPTTSKNYTYTQVTTALANARGGFNASIQCSNGALDEVYYYFETFGSVPTGLFVPAQPVGASSNCPASFRYLPKNLSSTYPVSTVSSSAAPTATLNQYCRPLYY